MAFKIASSPHIKQPLQTHIVMQRVLMCMLPGVAAQTYFFGWGVFIQIFIAVLVALAAEAAVMKIRARSIKHALTDYSAVVTAVLLAVSIPSMSPWWIIVIGTLFAILIVKQLYGGLGNNIFNPAMAAYILLLVSFPMQMTNWNAPLPVALNIPTIFDTLQTILGVTKNSTEHWRQAYDGVAMATPLDSFKTGLSLELTSNEILKGVAFDGHHSLGWFWINIGYFLGGLALLKLKIIRWHITGGILLALFICSSFSFLLQPDTHISPVNQLFSGATMLAAFFIATDPVTAATSPKGRLIFGALIGICVYIIRSFGGYPDAFAFAVLLANLSAPLIDYYVRPRSYGHRV
ncbi:electron transport complex subunit RsxD [Parashewanella spongiae]|uniref:Ion-translocating oxidoreductase complex subunit D n=1 Tax=Parashewanella spongiae TaxID=342950 RepID=A0A3A6TGQ8_9GAMM|nr:electron transport complex subunit RsxD [Parashewanella spongiae]MCL1078441.1 electron transport complex subunit RsxD [Parashewanella spongiae]RJY14844.1 electron transport complex subunit RsxD [Parashewanella spongiae]